ncbi:hypothetical protein Dip518_000206 [Parelusimicrobium proximum]|uniref:hypothetical protein n=1 Tax=Parelusimicrobium proximum TaxID=3228953 RepID=UPI003D180795
MFKKLLLLVLTVFICANSFAQIEFTQADKEILNKAMSYYQSLTLEQALDIKQSVFFDSPEAGNASSPGVFISANPRPDQSDIIDKMLADTKLLLSNDGEDAAFRISNSFSLINHNGWIMFFDKITDSGADKQTKTFVAYLFKLLYESTQKANFMAYEDFIKKGDLIESHILLRTIKANEIIWNESIPAKVAKAWLEGKNVERKGAITGMKVTLADLLKFQQAEYSFDNDGYLEMSLGIFTSSADKPLQKERAQKFISESLKSGLYAGRSEEKLLVLSSGLNVKGWAYVMTQAKGLSDAKKAVIGNALVTILEYNQKINMHFLEEYRAKGENETAQILSLYIQTNEIIVKEYEAVKEIFSWSKKSEKQQKNLHMI